MNEFIERYTTLVTLKRQYAIEQSDSLKRRIRVAQIKLGSVANMMRILTLKYKGYTNAGIATELGMAESSVRIIIERWKF